MDAYWDLSRRLDLLGYPRAATLLRIGLTEDRNPRHCLYEALREVDARGQLDFCRQLDDQERPLVRQSMTETMMRRIREEYNSIVAAKWLMLSS